MTAPTAVLIGTLDTKGREYAYVRERIAEAGFDVLVVDVGVLGQPHFAPDISSAEVCEAAGMALSQLQFDREGSDTRAVAMATMRDGAAAVVRRLVETGRCDGLLGMGGSGGSEVSSGAMRAAPFGVPKILVSTMASGDVSSYVGESDMCVMHSVTDIAGLNRVSRQVLENAAGALIGMVTARQRPRPDADDRLGVGITMLGVTTPGALRVAEKLEQAGYDPVVFHAVGSGGRAMESLLQNGTLGGVVDFTIKELTDATFGGIFAAGAERLRTAGLKGLPRVVVPGAIEVLNFGPIESVPAHLVDGSRPLVRHNAEVTAVCLTSDELAQMGRIVAERLNEGSGPIAVVVPTGGLDSYSVADGPFYDPASEARFIDSLRKHLSPAIRVLTVDADINDRMFADFVAETFRELEQSDNRRDPGHRDRAAGRSRDG